MSRRKKKSGTCVFCGYVGQLTREHIPPRCLFPDDCVEKLLVVHSCRKCNEATAKDDEYLRNTLVMLTPINAHPVLKDLAQKVRRSLRNPASRGLQKQFFDQFYFAERRSTSGLSLGVEPIVNINPSRIERVFGKIVKGLFFLKYDRILPKHCECYAMLQSGMGDLETELSRKHRELLENCAYKTPVVSVGDGIFQAWSTDFVQDTNASWWLMRFFDCIDFIGVTVDPTHPDIVAAERIWPKEAILRTPDYSLERLRPARSRFPR